MALSKILVIIDPTKDEQPAFERGLDSARLTGAQLHLYSCVNSNYGYADVGAAKAGLGQALKSLADRALDDGVETSTEIEWAQNWRTQTAVAAARCSASMVFKDSYDHRDVQRELRQTSDWTLLRMSPCPVLMVKNFHDWKHRRVLAAVNFHATDAAHIKLNNQIVSFAQQFTYAYGSDAHFVTAYADRNRVPSIRKLADICGAPVEHIHMAKGSAADVISQTARDLDVDLIIIGTVGRDGIKGSVVGNTSERLLDHTHTDVLVVN